MRLSDIEMCDLLVSIRKCNPLSALALNEDGYKVLGDEVSGDRQVVLEMLRAHTNTERLMD